MATPTGTTTAPPGPHGQSDILDEAQLEDSPGGASLRLRFRGPFEGHTVTWIATLHALAATAAEGRGPASGSSFIEVGDERAGGIPITVGLPVAAIDLPTIRKAIIMIRRYRRLRRGRHEYGPAPVEHPTDR